MRYATLYKDTYTHRKTNAMKSLSLITPSMLSSYSATVQNNKRKST